MNRSIFYLLSGVACVASALPAFAQRTVAPPAIVSPRPSQDEARPPERVTGRPVPVAIGATIQGRLTTSDPRISSDGAHYKLYSVTVPANTRLAIGLNVEDTGALDPYVEIGRLAGGDYSIIASNDDASGDNGLNSRLVITLSEAGSYVIRARSYGSDSVGPFTLKVEQLPPPPPPPTAIPIAFGQPKRGELTATDAQIDDDEAHYKYYSFTGAAGDRLALTMESAAFDAYVELGRMKDGEFEMLASDDDGGRSSTDNEARRGDDDHSGHNARLVVRLKESGPYVIRARAFGSDGLGAYTLAVIQLPPPPPAPAPVALTRGRAVAGSFTTSSAVMPSDEDADSITEGNRPYALYSIAGRAGQTVTVTANSEAFDTVLDAGGITPLGFGVVSSNDDSADADGRSTDSQLTLRFQNDGTIILRVSALGSGGEGRYRITAR